MQQTDYSFRKRFIRIYLLSILPDSQQSANCPVWCTVQQVSPFDSNRAVRPVDYLAVRKKKTIGTIIIMKQIHTMVDL